MNVDLLVLAVLVLFAVLGASSGVLRQMVMLTSTVLGYLAARYLAPPVATGFTRGPAQPLARALAGVLFFFAVMFLAGFLGRTLIARMGGGRAVRSPADRGLGALLGAAKAALGLWVVISAFVLLGRPVGPSFFRLEPQGGDFTGLAADYNALDTWVGPTGTTLRRVLVALRDPAAGPGLAQDEDLRALLEDPRLQQVIQQSASVSGGINLTASPEMLRLLADPVFLQRLEKAQKKLDQITK